MARADQHFGRVRRGGILLHITSLPGQFGIGDLGPAAYAWVDALAKTGQTLWQVLPLNPAGAGNSPYQCYSAFAGNPDLISPELLAREGLIMRSELDGWNLPKKSVDYERVTKLKRRMLAGAWERFQGRTSNRLVEQFEHFCDSERWWMEDFALFMAIREACGGRPWARWGRGLVMRERAAIKEAKRQLGDVLGRERFTQFLFFRQLGALRKHARARGVRVIGDLPIYVAGESADVWANPHLFQLDRLRRPKAVAGVPPDYFSKTGQWWGNPLYDWPAMKKDRYRWWVARMKGAFTQADIVRIDHFRGLQAYWRVPATAKTAQSGRWVKGPGEELFAALRRDLGDVPVIAEDLGLITPDVEVLRDRLGLPGMRVLQFAFGSDAENPYLPHNHIRNSVVYTGTHDNDTTAGWYASLAARERKRVERYTGCMGQKEVVWGMIELAWGSVASFAIAPMQDVLGLGSNARMNLPGSIEGNWRWRLEGDSLTRSALERLGELTETYGRLPT